MKLIDLRDWIYRKLGAPVVRINIDDKQTYDSIHESVEKFMNHHYEGSTKATYILNVTAGQQTYTLPDNIMTILYVIDDHDQKLIPSEIRQVVYEDMFYQSGGHRIGASDWTIFQQQMSLISYIFNKEIDFIWDRTSKTIRFLDKIEESTTFALAVYEHLDINDVDDGSTYLQNILEVEWVKLYAKELIREQWGQNLIKFDGITILGGIKISGDKLKQEANENIEKLKQELYDVYGGIDAIYFG